MICLDPVITKQGLNSNQPIFAPLSNLRVEFMSMWINPPFVFFSVGNLTPRMGGINSELSNAPVAETQPNEKRESPQTRDLRRPATISQSWKKPWQVSRKPEDEELDGRRRGKSPEEENSVPGLAKGPKQGGARGCLCPAI